MSKHLHTYTYYIHMPIHTYIYVYNIGMPAAYIEYFHRHLKPPIALLDNIAPI